MLKLFFVLLITAIVMIFAFQNMRPVRINFLFKEIESINLVLLIFITYILGVLTMYFHTIIRDIKRKKKKKILINSRERIK